MCEFVKEIWKDTAFQHQCRQSSSLIISGYLSVGFGAIDQGLMHGEKRQSDLSPLPNAK